MNFGNTYSYQVMVIDKDNEEFRRKLLAGLDKSFEKLVRDTAAQNGTLVLADEHGTIKHVPAKDLLPKEKK